MAHQPTEAVIAGSKSFALALLAPLTERVGTRPRIAADAAQAVKLTGGAGLVVVEFQGDGSLASIRELVDSAAGVSVVAAIPDGHTGAEEALRSLGVEPARWDGKPDAVLSAVARRLGLSAVEPGAPAGAVPPGSEARPADPAPSPAMQAPSPGVGRLFDGMGLDELAPEAPPPSSAAPAAAGAPGSGPAPACDWPGAVPGDAAAAEALSAAMRGVSPPAGSPFAVVADVMAGMSPVERAVLLGEPQPVDPEPIRKAAIMRVRVAVALATAPRDGAAVDAGAVSALLAEIDGLLSRVNAQVAAAPAELQPSLEEIRNVLVKEAIDFSEAAQPAEASEAAAPTPAVRRGATATRVVSMATAGERTLERAAERRHRWMWALLAAAALAAAVFHGERLVRPRVDTSSDRPARTGAPVGAVVLTTPAPGSPTVIRSSNGQPFTPGELKQMEETEALRGNTVRVVGPAAVLVLPVQPGDAQGVSSTAAAARR